MSSASSNQLVVRDGLDYEEVYPSGHREQDSPDDRSPSSSSSSSTYEDMEVVDQDEGPDDGEEQIVRSVIGADGLREFVMLPEWTVNYFTSVIKKSTLRHLGIIIKFQKMLPSVYPTNRRSVTMKG